MHCLDSLVQVSHTPGKSWIFLGTISRSWKVLENGFDPGKSWKFECKVLESPGIFYAMIMMWEADKMTQVQMPKLRVRTSLPIVPLSEYSLLHISTA